MMFASRTPRDIFNPGPPTNDYWFDQRYEAEMFAQESAFVQHNPPNPILIEFRKYANIVAGHEWPLTPPQLAAHWTQNDDMWCEVTLDDHDNPVGTPAQVAHARRVLERLARCENA